MTNGDIFIVDDNPNNLQLLEGILAEHQYKVRMASNGKRALAAINAAIPELILLDITMPDMDGYQVCQQLKANSKLSSVPVIFISALDDVLDKVKAFKTGAVDYITKPFQAEEVIARVENQLAIFRLRKELEKRNEELAKEKEALILAQKHIDEVFSTLSEVLPGMVLDGKYQLEKKIGMGGFGAVYEAVQLSLNRPIAIKVFRPGRNNKSSNLERFRLEGISACQVNHPNSISIIDFGISSTGIAYLAMELLNGCTLEKEIAKSKITSPSRCIEILIPICSVLMEAHRLGIIHRDIKPDNIFIHQSNEGEIIKVLDFGIAKIFSETLEQNLQNLTSENALLGTPNYMAPERIQLKSYDGRADIYSLGVIFYQMLCGELPFKSKGEAISIFSMHVNTNPVALREKNPNIPVEIENIVLKMMEKRPEYRPTAKEVFLELTKHSSVDIKKIRTDFFNSVEEKKDIKENTVGQTIISNHSVVGNETVLDAEKPEN
ncbi:MAG: response regulator [Blastocatellia bacterium]